MDKKELLNLSATELLEKLHSSVEGISASDAEKRQQTYGFNILKKHSVDPFKILIKQFASSLIYLLIVAAGLSFLLRDISDGLVITTILLINALLGFFQEYRSQKAIEKLAKLISRQILVKRDGKSVLLDEKMLVPGDIVTIKEGDIVPADMMLLSVDSLSVNESQLSGESAAVVKSVRKSASQHLDSSLVFAGSIVEQGEAEGIVYATGYKTELGHIASLSQTTQKVTQYEKSLQQFSNYLMRLSLLTLVIIFAAKLLISHDFSHITGLLLFIIALAITVIPEALPVIATLTLAKGAMRLAKRHVVVKRLSSLEDLGNITLLCTDKTGTLTENNMSIAGISSHNPSLFQTLAIATLETLDEKRRKLRDPYDAAFFAYIPQEFKDQAKHFKQIEDLAFDPAARRRRVIIQDTKKNTYYLVVIGSAEMLVKISHAAGKQAIIKEIHADGKQGIRNLAIAYKEISYKENFDILRHEDKLTFIGYAKLVDPLRKTTKHTIELAEKLGIGIKVLTGDSAEVAEYVGREIGLLKATDKVFTGEELEKMTADEFKSTVEASSIFAKVTPEQKYAIIKTLKQKHVVGYQGDGINDAPALKLADVGIAVNTATDVAKESAEILLLQKDLEVIINGIHYGRMIFVNINKYIKYTMVGNFGNFFALAGLYLLATDLPLLPIQLLLTNLVTDLPHVFIYSDHVNNYQVKKPQAFDIHSLMFISLLLGSVTALFEFIFFATLKLQANSFTQTSLFLFLTFQLVIIFSIRNTDYFWKGKGPSWLLTVATFATCLLAVLIVSIPPIASIFAFSPLPISELASIVIITEVYFIVLDVMKVWYYNIVQNSK